MKTTMPRLRGSTTTVTDAAMKIGSCADDVGLAGSFVTDAGASIRGSA